MLKYSEIDVVFILTADEYHVCPTDSFDVLHSLILVESLDGHIDSLCGSRCGGWQSCVYRETNGFDKGGCGIDYSSAREESGSFLISHRDSDQADDELFGDRCRCSWVT